MKQNILTRIFSLYYDGFRSLSLLGKKLWLIILIKLFLFFVLLRLIFFPDFLKSEFNSDQERGNYVIDELTK